MRIDDNSQSALDALFDAEPEGVHILPGRQDGEIVVSFIQDHFVHSAAFEPKSYFDHISFGALEWLYKQYGDLKAQVSNLSQVELENTLLKEEVARLNHQIFGVSSEQSAKAEDEDPAFPPFSTEPDQNVIPLPIGVSPEARVNSRGAGRKPLPAHLPRERVVHELPAEERLCPCCNNAMHSFEGDVTEQLTVIPAQYKVLQHVRMNYVCRDCKEMKTAPGPKWLIAKSSYSSADFLAHMLCNKFQFGLPFYRQEAIFEQAGLPFNRTTLANLTIRCTDKLSALYETLRHELLLQDVIHADETEAQVLKETDKEPHSRSWLWLYRSREDAPQQIVLFDYQVSRRKEHPRKFLGVDGERPFTGYLQVDGYAGYNGLPVTRVGCMVHVRRKFAAVINTLPHKSAPSPAHQAMDIIGRLYGIERKIKGLPHRIRYKVRQEESVPILHELKAWLDDMKPKVVPRSGLGKAIGYALDQWTYVRRYVDDGRLAIDNNISEREIKAVVIGRKNWLFADSAEGMYANALMYSLVQTAKANGINPFDYLKYVIETMPYLSTADEVKSLLPWNMPRAIPEKELEAA